MSNNTKVVTAFSFWEFCTEVQALVIDGYRFSTDNDKMPSAYVGNYSCVMVKEEEVLISTQPVVPDANEEVKTKGRKPKN